MTRRICFHLTLLVLFAVAAASPALAGAVLDRIVEQGEIRVGMTGDQPPLTMTSKTGELIGFDVDLAHLLASSMEVRPTLVIKPFAELLPALHAGELDMIISGMTITPHRNTKVAFVGPYNITGKSILTRPGALAAAEDTSDINKEDLVLVALAGSTSERFVKLFLPETKLTTIENYEAGVQAVLEERADAMVADIEICQFTIMRHPDAKLATLAVPLTIEPLGIALPPDDPLLINLIENFLATLQSLDLLEELRAKWYEGDSWLSELP